MARDTKPNLFNGQFEQESADVLTLCGTTNIHNVLSIKPVGIIDSCSTLGYRISGSTFLRAGGNTKNSVYIGNLAGNGTSTAQFNIALGLCALNQNTNTGIGNIAIGTCSLYSETTGCFNTAVGFASLCKNIVGNFNTAIGGSTLSDSIGSYNTAVGTSSMGNLSTGSTNTSIGYSSGDMLCTGDRNTLIGSMSGVALIHGCNNIFIGYYSGYNCTGSNLLSIGNSNCTDAELISGCFTTGVVNLKTLRLLNEPINGVCTDSVLVWNATDKCIKKLPYSSGTTMPSSYICAVTITGNGTATGFTAQHNFNTTDVVAQILDGTTLANVYVDMYRPNNACVVVRFETAPALNKTYRVLMMK